MVALGGISVFIGNDLTGKSPRNKKMTQTEKLCTEIFNNFVELQKFQIKLLAEEQPRCPKCGIELQGDGLCGDCAGEEKEYTAEERGYLPEEEANKEINKALK